MGETSVVEGSCNSLPRELNFVNDPTALKSDSIPVIDFSLLKSSDPHQRSKVIQQLGKACQDWGFFILVNHGLLESDMTAMFEAVTEYFSLPAEEKPKYERKNALDPIQCGDFDVKDASNKTFSLWRDFLKTIVYPEFHCPLKPEILREALQNYSEKTRKLGMELLEAISETLGLEKAYMEESLKLDSSLQIFAANYYPPCPQPDRAIGLPPHTDYGLLTFLVPNGVDGLQIEHDGDWFNADAPPNSILVNTCDQLQVFSNGRFKSANHRAVLNSEKTRISIVTNTGPSLDAIVGPTLPLVERDGGRALYKPMEYREFVEEKLTNARVGISLVEKLKIIKPN